VYSKKDFAWSYSYDKRAHARGGDLTMQSTPYALEIFCRGNFGNQKNTFLLSIFINTGKTIFWSVFGISNY